MATGSGASVLAVVTSTGAGAELLSGSGASVLGPLASAGTGAEVFPGAGASVLSPLASAGLGREQFTGVGASLLKPVTSSGSALASQGPIIDMEGEPEVALGVNAQTGTAYTLTHNDRERLITFDNAAAIAFTLPPATGAFGVGFRCWVFNKGNGMLTATPISGTINDAASRAIRHDRGVLLWSDGVNWLAMGDFN